MSDVIGLELDSVELLESVYRFVSYISCDGEMRRRRRMTRRDARSARSARSAASVLFPSQMDK